MSDNELTTTQPAQLPAPVNPHLPDRKEAEEEGLLQTWSKTGGLAVAGFDLLSDAGMVRESQAWSKADFGARDAVGREFELVDYYAHVVTIMDPVDFSTAELVRIVLWTADGKRIGTVSRPCAKRLAWLRARKPMTPWSPPIRVRFNQYAASNGRSYVDFELMPAAVEPSPANGQKPRKGTT